MSHRPEDFIDVEKIASGIQRAKFGGASGDLLKGFGGGGLNLAARLAASQPGLSRSEFEHQLQSLGGLAEGADVDSLFGVYNQLTSPTGTSPQNADEVTTPEPEGPGRFGATRPGDLLGASALRFGA